MPVIKPDGVYLDERWSNGARVRVFLFDEPVEGEHASDRIQLHITTADGNERGWLMNIEDAVSIITGLSAAMNAALWKDIPISKNYQADSK